MNEKLWEKAKAVFDQIADLNQAEKEEQHRLLCGSDQELFKLVDTLIKGDENPLVYSGIPLLFSESSDLPEKIGPYDIVRFLGKGGMGTVFEGIRRGEDFEQRVAVKLFQNLLMDSGSELRFRRERHILAQLEHPNIARFLDGGSCSMGSYIGLEYISGSSIMDYATKHRLNTKQRIELFLQLCEAVSFSHQNLVIHRDLKPSNVMVTDKGQVKLLDFGIAKLLEEHQADRDLMAQTKTGLGPLTPQYASPEQFLGEAVTTRTDVYGLGLLLYELLTGVRVYQFDVASLKQIESQIVHDMPSKPSLACQSTEKRVPSNQSIPGNLASELKGDLDSIVLQCLRKEPNRRFSSVSELILDLQNYLQGRPVKAHPDSLGYRISKTFKRNKLKVLAMSSLFLLLIVVTTMSLIWGNQLAQKNRDISLERDRAESVSDFLVDLFESASPYQEAGDDLSTKDLVRLGSQQLQKRFNHDLKTRAKLETVLGQIHMLLGDLERSKELCSKALEDLKGFETTQAKLYIKALTNYAELMSRMSKPEEAEKDFQKAISLETDPASKAQILLQLGIHYNRTEQFQKSLEMFDSIFASNLVSPGSLLEANIWDAKSQALQRSGEYSKSEKWNRAALDQFQKLLGTDNQRVVDSLSDLAITLDSLGKYEEAEETMHHCLEKTIELLGDEHPSCATMWNNLGIIAGNRGDFERSLSYLKKAFAIRNKVLGPKHFNTLVTLTNLGYTCDSLERFEEAQGYYLRSLEIARETLGPENPQLGYIHNNLSYNLKQQHKLKESLKHAEMACDIFGKDPSAKLEYRMSLNLLSGAHYEMGQYKDSLTISQKVLDLSAGEKDMTKVRIMAHKSRARAFQALKQKERAVEEIEMAKTLARSFYGDESEELKALETFFASNEP